MRPRRYERARHARQRLRGTTSATARPEGGAGGTPEYSAPSSVARAISDPSGSAIAAASTPIVLGVMTKLIVRGRWGLFRATTSSQDPTICRVRDRRGGTQVTCVHVP